jgi:hypothetical protein
MSQCEARYISNLEKIRIGLHPDVVSDIDNFLEGHKSGDQSSTFTRTFATTAVTNAIFDYTALWHCPEADLVGLYTGYLGQGHYYGIYYDMDSSSYVYWTCEATGAKRPTYSTANWPEMLTYLANRSA